MMNKELTLTTQETMGEVASANTNMDMLTNPETSFYCSIPDDGSRKAKVAIYNAVNNSEKSLSDMIGKPLDIVDVVAYPVTLADEETGEVIESIRTVLIDKDGTSYSAVSSGITNSLSKIFAIVGSPLNGAWHDEPVKMEVKQVNTRNGNNKVNTIVLL